MKFRCKQSGNVFEFVNEHDIKTMRSHPEYEEVVEVNENKIEEVTEPVIKKAGRPKKIAIVD